MLLLIFIKLLFANALVAQPKADFKVDKQEGCSPLSVSFTDQSTGNAANYFWRFGNGNTSTKKDPDAVFIQPGQYTVTLVVTGTNGQKDSTTKNQLITVFTNPTADFTTNDKSGCKPLSSRFNNRSQKGSAPIKNYTWDFGDGGSSNNKNPNYQFTSAGNFTVALSIVDTNGCKDEAVKQDLIGVSKNPDVNFFTPDTTACNPPLVANFQEKAQSKAPGGLNYQWDFGNGSTSQKPNPQHTYQQKGVFDVQLTVTDTNGCQATKRKNGYIKTNKIIKGFNLNLDFSADPSKACKLPTNVQFNATGQTSKVRSYRWEVGDGSVKSGQSPQHQYTQTGDYSVTLRITDQNGCQQRETNKDMVEIKRPNAQFRISPSDGCRPLDVQFTNQSNSSVDSIVNYDWDFDDGNSATVKNPNHTYQDSGFYHPSLRITTQKGCKDTFTFNKIRVGINSNPDFTVNNRKGCLDHRVRFTNLTDIHPPDVDSFHWIVGDGTDPISNFEVSHKYDHPPDSLNVKLIGYHNGCKDQEIKEDYIILKPPFADFEPLRDSCIDKSIQFNNLSVAADSFKWNLNDDTISFKEEPFHKFKEDSFFVELVVWNDTTNCVDTHRKTFKPYNAKVKRAGTGGCATAKVNVEATANRDSRYRWDFGNGDTAFQRKTRTFYNRPDTYDINLLATSTDKQCTEQITLEDHVVVNGVNTSLSTTKNQGCTPFQTVFKMDRDTSASIRKAYLTTGDNQQINNPGDSIQYTYQDPPQKRNAFYQATYHVEDVEGCSNESSISVRPAEPRPKKTIQKTPFCDSVQHVFKANPQPKHGIQPKDYQWQFTPGDTYQQQSVKKHLANDSRFEVSLTVIDSLGCRETLTDTFTFESRSLRASFTADTTYGNCPPLEVNFFDLSNPGYTPIKQWKWQFGDNSFSNKQNPKNLYFLPGQYDVSLTVTDSLGCKDTFNGEEYIVLDGPLAEYEFGPLKGCSPHEVTFDATTDGASEVKWDMGDGTVLDQKDVTYAYNRSASYIPRLILSDSAGCTYALPPKDTIQVKPSPESRFSVKDRCFGYPTNFNDSSKPTEGGLQTIKWDIGNNGEIDQEGDSATTIFKEPGDFPIRQIVQGANNCWDTLIRKVDIGGLDARFKANDTTTCVEEQAQFIDLTFADTTIDEWIWRFGDSTYSYRKNPTRIYKEKKQADVKLTVKDVEGCQDSLFQKDYMGIGNRRDPQVPPIYRATVLNGSEVKLEFAQFTDFDVERYLIYRKRKGNGNFQVIDSLGQRSDTSLIDKGLNTLNHSYCYKIQVETYCHRFSSLDSSEKHCTIELQAEPDTNRALLNWNHYKGWDSVKRYEVYRKKIKTPQYFQIGQVPGDSTFYIDSSIVCYRKHDYRVKAVEDSGFSQVSRSDISDAEPTYIPNVPANKVLRATVKDNRYNRLEWTNPPETGVYQYLVTRVTTNANEPDQTEILKGDQLAWEDYAVNVDEHSYRYLVQVMDSCRDIGPLSNQGKTILLKVGLDKNYRPELHWTPYQKWESGVNQYKIQLKRNEQFQTIAQVDGTDTTFTDQITNLNSLDAYRYRVQATKSQDSAIISTSNVALTEPKSTLHVPNAFSPNKDGHNETFKPKGLYIDNYNMIIYDRWGNFVFETNGLDKGWDGIHDGTIAQDDVYIYHISAKGLDGKLYELSGDLTLIK